jgi:hypothetical protein
MSLFEEFIGMIIQEIFLSSIRIIGAGVRWLFLKKKFSFKEIRSQSWNGRVGLITMFIIGLLVFQLSQIKSN